ncbi:MAG: hypothetical protein GX649_07150, partial [Chloroflexi bacterium]|nr:hypothetical protein [Chloroflexota bacterium]
MAHKSRIGISSVVGVLVSAALLLSLCAGASASVVGEWTKTGGPSSERGNVRLLAVDQEIAGTAYAVIAAAGLSEVYRTEDAGAEWTSAYAFPQTLGSLVARDGLLYAGATGVRAGETAIWRSIDAGASWLPVYTATADTDVRGLAFAPRPAEEVYAALATSDGGAVLRGVEDEAWAEVLASEGSFDAVAVAPTDAAIVYAAGNDADHMAQVYRSIDGGAGWTPVLSSETETFQDLLVIDPSDANTVLAKARVDTCCPPPAASLWRTTDGGDTWDVTTQRGLYVPVFAGPSAIYDLQNRERTLNAFDAAPVWEGMAAELPEQVPTGGAA